MEAFIGRHPEFTAFANWAGTAPWTSSYAEDPFNSLNSFLFTDAGGTTRAVRWSLRPSATPVPIAPDELAKRGPNYLEQEIASRVAGTPQRWTMVVTVAEPGDVTADPSRAWPVGRRTVEVCTARGEQGHRRAERSVPRHQLRPDGAAARHERFRRSVPRSPFLSLCPFYDLRTSEAKDYPRTASAGSNKP
jgi:catalase